MYMSIRQIRVGRWLLCGVAALMVGGSVFWAHTVRASGAIELYSTSLFNNANLVSYYRFEGNSNDAKGSNNGTATPAVTYSTSTGMFSEGANFNGSNTRITTPVGMPTSSWNGVTVTAWVYPENTSGYSSIAGNRGAYGDYFILGTHNTNWRWHILSAGIEDIGVSFTPNTWYMITGTWDGSTMRFYVDGAEVWSHAYSDSFGNSPRSLTMGSSDPGGFWEEYNGSLDDLAVFSRALTATEVSNLYNGNGFYITQLNQYQTDGTTTIAAGGVTTQGAVAFGAVLNSGGSSTLQLQAEVKPTGYPFTDSPNTSSTFVSSGANAVATYSGSNSSYHWQARVVDANGSSSAWQAFSDPAISTVDFIINHIPNNEASAQFNGSSSWAWPASNLNLGDSSPFTIELWYKAVSTSTMGNLIDMRNSSTGKGFVISENSNGANLTFNCDATTSLQITGIGADITSRDPEGNWHHVAITRGTTTSVSPFALYFDGQAKSLNNCFDASTTKPIWFAGSAVSTSTQGFFKGYMDEVRIWNIQRSADDITASATQEISSSSTGLIGYWTFNGTSTELVKGYATSGQVGNPLIAYRISPMGPHFIDYAFPPSVRNGAIRWFASTTYSLELSDAVNTWDAQGPISITSTTATSTADLLVMNSSTDDVSWSGEWCPKADATDGCPAQDTIWLNQYVLDTNPVSSVQRTIAHEFGHSLGLAHSVFGNIMYFLGSGQKEASTTLGAQDQYDYNYLWGN